MKLLFIFLSSLIVFGCSKPKEQTFSDDYILIEFAGKLEEESQNSQKPQLQKIVD